MKRNVKGQINKIYSDEYIKKLLKEKEETGISINNLAIREGASKGTLSYRFKKLGYTFSKRKHSINERYFENIDTELKAYFLGFAMADGCISKTLQRMNFANRFSINISQKDKIVLEKLKEELNTTYEIEDYVPHFTTFGTSTMSRLVINSMTMCRDLYEYGITNSKTGNETLPTISEDLIPHFIRGFLDGDGSTTGGNISFCCSSRDTILNDLYKYFKEWGMTGALSIRLTKTTLNGKLYTLSINSAHDKKIFCDKVYKNATFYLQRKYDNL